MPVRGRHPRHRLTDLMVRQAGPGRHADGDGLYIYVRPSGSRSWMQRLMVQGERLDRGLGSYPLVSLADARRTAEERRRVARAGGDPFAASPAKVVPTVREMWEVAIELRRKDWTNPGSERKWRRTFNKFVAEPIGEKRVDEVTVKQVRTIVSPIWQGRGSDGWLVLLHLTHVMNLAVVDGHRTDNPAAPIPSVLSNKTKRPVEHHPSLDYREVCEAMVAVQNSPGDEVTKRALLFVVLTASRLGEVIGAQWREIDWETGIWTRPAKRMKAKDEHTVPLPEQGIDILKWVLALGRSDKFIFVVPDEPNGVRQLTATDFSNVLRPLGYRDKKMDRPIVMHGFRATFRTWGSEKERARYEALELALAHLSDPTVRAYARTALIDERQEVMQAWADYMLPRSKAR